MLRDSPQWSLGGLGEEVEQDPDGGKDVTPASIEDTCQRCIERHGRFIVARRGHGWQSRHEIDKKATVCYRVTQTCS